MFFPTNTYFTILTSSFVGVLHQQKVPYTILNILSNISNYYYPSLVLVRNEPSRFFAVLRMTKRVFLRVAKGCEAFNPF